MKKIISVLLLGLFYAIMGFKEAFFPAWNVWIEIGISFFLLLIALLINPEKLNVKNAISFLLFFAFLLILKLNLPGTIESKAGTALCFLLLLVILLALLFLNKQIFAKEKSISMQNLLSILLILLVIYLLRMHLLKTILPAAYIAVEIVLSVLVLAALIYWNRKQLK